MISLLLLVATGVTEDSCAEPTAPVSTPHVHASDPPCFFPTELIEVPVANVRRETHNSKVISFELPAGVSLNLPVSSAILLNAIVNDKNLARPYNPISSNLQLGSFELLVKVYEQGKASQWVNSLQLGDRVSFKQVKGNVKPFRYPFGKATVTMVAGGTGIAPMLQALHPLLTTPGDTTRVRLLYGSHSPADIMLKAEIDTLAHAHPERFEVFYVVGSSADAAPVAGWSGETGWVDEDKVRRLGFPPSDDTAVWVCGVDDMYTSLAGSRMKPLAAGSALHNLGYTQEMVWRS